MIDASNIYTLSRLRNSMLILEHCAILWLEHYVNGIDADEVYAELSHPRKLSLDLYKGLIESMTESDRERFFKSFVGIPIKFSEGLPVEARYTLTGL